jgi:hypothetical protein
MSRTSLWLASFATGTKAAISPHSRQVRIGWFASSMPDQTSGASTSGWRVTGSLSFRSPRLARQPPGSSASMKESVCSSVTRCGRWGCIPHRRRGGVSTEPLVAHHHHRGSESKPDDQPARILRRLRAVGRPGAEAQMGFVVDPPHKPQFRSCPRRCHWRSFAVRFGFAQGRLTMTIVPVVRLPLTPPLRASAPPRERILHLRAAGQHPGLAGHGPQRR